MMNPSEQIDQLQDELVAVRHAGDKAREIQCLIEIATCSGKLQDIGLQKLHLDLASREIQRSGQCTDKLHRVLGERALLMRRAKRYEDSLRLYKEAADAAREFNGRDAEALWIGKQGHIHRLAARYAEAETCYRRAQQIFSELGAEGYGGLADQEGNLGILAQARGEADETFRRYRRAVELAGKATDAELISTWTTNFANELTRRRFYERARDAYSRAYALSLEIGDEERIHTVAAQWSVCNVRAHRRDLSANVLLETADHLSNERLIVSLLMAALVDLQILDDRDRMRDTLARLDDIAAEREVPEQVLRSFRAYIEMNDRLDAEAASPADEPGEDQPTLLEVYVVDNMAQAEKEHDVDRMMDVSALICDVNSGLTTPSDSEWHRYLRDPFLRYRVIADTIRALAAKDRAGDSLELSQRFKGAGFRVAALHALREQAHRTGYVDAYLDAQAQLEREIQALSDRRVVRPLPVIEAVRSAGERLLEASALLKEKDRILDFRLGGIVQPDELLDAMPMDDAVAICDFFTSYDGTTLHILFRSGNSVQISCGVAEEFTLERCAQILQDLMGSGFQSEISARQRESLLHMGQELHDYLMCGLAKSTHEVGLTQFVFVPDPFLQSLPLGLSLVCGQDLQVPGVTRGDENLLAEVFPHEYVPCLQAIAVSQHQKRPSQVKKVLVVSDPKLDLPGAFYAGQRLEESIGDPVACVALPREEATLQRFLDEVQQADIVVLGTHGDFNAGKPLVSRLLLHDQDWTLEEMLRQPPFQRSPVIILSSCEVGAVSPGSDAAISGIPGALISAGAACVIASSWPLVDVPGGYLVDRLIQHLARPGLRPAAALFRALRDLQTWNKATILAHTAAILKQMDEDGSADRFPGEFIQVDHFYDVIDGSDHDLPLSGPEIWGGTAVYGSGWSAPAGAYVGRAAVIGLAEIILERQTIKAKLHDAEFAEALSRVNKLLHTVEGAERARLLELKAQIVWRNGQSLCPSADQAEALELLDDAQFTAEAEQDEQLLRNIRATKQKILL